MKLRKKLASLLTSLALACSLAACLPAQTVLAADADESVYQSGQAAVRTSDEIVYESAFGKVVAVSNDAMPPQSDVKEATKRVAASGQTDADFIRMCGSKNSYTYLGTLSNGANIQKFYNQMYDACVELWDQSRSLSSSSFMMYKDCYIVDYFSYGSAGITEQQAFEAYVALKTDNPLFYFIDTTVSYNTSLKCLMPLVSPEYFTESSRASAQSAIKSYLKTIAGKVSWKYTNYYKALVINNYIVNNCSYAFDRNGDPELAHYAHCVMGPINKKLGVCEAYARLYQLCLNYVGVECHYVSGKGGSEAHGWNIVRLDDGKYYNYDVTWNDTNGYNRYIAKGTAFFYKNHTPSTPSGKHLEWQAKLPAVSVTDYNGTKATYKTMTSSFTQTLSNVKAINTTYTTATVRWDIPSTADGVYVYLYNESTKKYNLVAKKTHYDNEYRFTELTPGSTYRVLLRTFYVYNGSVLTSTNGNPITFKSRELPSTAAKITRYSGSNRYGTAVEISKASAEKSDYVVIASGAIYADALAGVPLANAYKAPILLTAKDSVDAGTMAQIKSLGATKAIILGGTGVVSDKVKNQLEAQKLTVERIAGTNRFETSVKIAQRLLNITETTPDMIFFVYYNNFADALSIGSVAGNLSSPILYINGDGNLDASTKGYLDSFISTIANGYIIGGPGLIKSKADQNIQGYFTKSGRIYGNNRYETNMKINTAFDKIENYAPYIATGLNFPDALAGGVLAAQKGQPIYLVGKTLTNLQAMTLKNHSTKNIYIFGGSGAVSNELAYEAAASCAA